MNKKLTTILLAALIILIGKVDAATLTQKIGEGYIRSTVVEGQEVTIKFVSSKYTFSSWTVESGNISIDTTNPVVTFTMPSSNVIIRANYEGDTQSNITLSSAVNVGDYVKYVPSSTSYTVPTTVSGYSSDQNFNPSSTTSWRVFSNDGTNVEIISTDSVGDLSLRGSTGYINAVQTLQDMSAAYVNPEYAASGRSLGYSEDGLTDIANYKTIDTDTYPLEYGISRTFPYSDGQWTSDQTVLSNHGSMYHSSGYVWPASRTAAASTDNSGSAFYGTRMDASGAANGTLLYYVNSDGSVGTSTKVSGVRPIVSLKSGIMITSGSGTSTDPYIITESTTSKYTVTYCANGGYGDMNPQSVAQGSSITLTTNIYEHHGSYAFAGWATSATATSATYTDGASVTPTADMTLYAVWEDTCTHSYSSTITTAATCTTTGVRTYTCSQCANSYTETIAVLEHNYTYTLVDDIYHNEICQNCGESTQLAHSFVNGNNCSCGKECDLTPGKVEYLWESSNLTVDWNWTQYDNFRIVILVINETMANSSSSVGSSTYSTEELEGNYSTISLSIQVDFDMDGKSYRWVTMGHACEEGVEGSIW